MFIIKSCALPEQALLQRYRSSGAFTDCYRSEITAAVTHAEFVQAFYTTWLFKLERLILKWVVDLPSTDAQAQQLAQGGSEQFAAWRVEERSDNQLLLTDYRGRTRSWLMTHAIGAGEHRRTWLYFGSAVVAAQPGGQDIGRGFRLLLGFHKLYSRLLLYSASSSLRRSTAGRI